MIIEIIDDQTIEVFGETNEQAYENAQQLTRFIGNDRWVSLSGMEYGSCFNLERKYKRRIGFKKAP